MEHRLGIIRKLRDHGTVSAIGNRGDDVAGESRIAGRHHHRGGAHRIAMQQNACIRISCGDQRNPAQQIVAFQQSHTHVAPFAQFMGALRG